MEDNKIVTVLVCVCIVVLSAFVGYNSYRLGYSEKQNESLVERVWLLENIANNLQHTAEDNKRVFEEIDVSLKSLDSELSLHYLMIEDLDNKLFDIEKDVQQCLVENEHLWYHYDFTRKTQNDILEMVGENGKDIEEVHNELQETNKEFEEHYHGPKPLLY